MLVYHHSNQLGIGGTEKVMCLFVKYLRQKNIDARIITNGTRDLTRLQWCKDEGIPVELYKTWEDYKEIVRDADIVHFHRGGWPEPPCEPGFHSDTTKLVETNIFGFADYQDILDASFFLTDRTEPVFPQHFKVRQRQIPNAISKPQTTKKLTRPSDKFIFGKVQRPSDSIYEPGPHSAVATLKDIEYWVVNPCPILQKFNPPNHLFLPEIVDDKELSQFLNTIDVFLHSRKDGESFGCAIFEAMMHGKPVITHVSGGFNAHIDIMLKCELQDWIVQNPQNLDEWKDRILWSIKEMSDDKKKRKWTKKFKEIGKTFEAEKITDLLLEEYKLLLK